MEEITLQITGDKLKPFSVEDLEKLKNYRQNQVVNCKIKGIRKKRSYEQLKLFWAACRLVAENSEDSSWNTKEKVSYQIRYALQFFEFDQIIVSPDGYVHTPVRSISYKNLCHMDACDFFDKAFDLMAKYLRIDVETLRRASNG